EAMVAQNAKSRHDIVVTAVYWRANEHVAVGEPAQRPPISRPAPLAENSRLGELRAESPAQRQRLEPLQQDEVAAFRKALAAGVRGEQALAAAGGSRPAQANGQSYTLLTGFEDTEMADGGQADLSGTQYGTLR